MGVAWIPERDGAFVAAHADGNLYVYEKASFQFGSYMFLNIVSKDGSVESSFPVIKDQTQFSVAHARSSKSNPIARWHICQGPINAIAFSADGRYLATVGRDGIYLAANCYVK
ncbi:putative transcription factor WD40-like family [Helianthus anomalus]